VGWFPSRGAACLCVLKAPARAAGLMMTRVGLPWVWATSGDRDTVAWWWPCEAWLGVCAAWSLFDLCCWRLYSSRGVLKC